MSNEYYVKVDNKGLRVSLCTYTFNCFHPNGIERNLTSVGYDKNSGFTFKQARDLMNGLCEKLNRTNWNREKDVWLS